MSDRRPRGSAAPKEARSKVFNIISAFAIAIILWAYVVGQVNPTVTDVVRAVPVQLLNMDTLTSRGLTLSGETEFAVDVVVEGSRSDLAALKKGSVIAEANLFGYGLGENSIPVDVEIPSGLTLQEVRSSRVTVTIEELVGSARSIEVDLQGSLPSGYELGEIVTTPREVTVSGPRSYVESVASLEVSVEAASLSTSGSTQTLALTPLDREGEPVEGVTLSADSVEFYTELWRVKALPYQVQIEGELDENETLVVKTSADSILVKGPQELLAGISEIKSKPLHLDGIASEAAVETEPELPEGIALADNATVPSVSISVQSVQELRFSFQTKDVETEDLAETLRAEIADAELLVTAKGSSSVISALTQDDVRLALDLNGLEAGVYQVPLRIDCRADLIEIGVSPTHLEVTLTEAGAGAEAPAAAQ